MAANRVYKYSAVVYRVSVYTEEPPRNAMAPVKVLMMKKKIDPYCYSMCTSAPMQMSPHS
jgi:hypothetical protein